MDLQDQGVIDSGCSRHMTGNMSYLTDYEEIDGGYVAFGGNPKGGKITGKCTIKTGNLDFENVYFVRELKFNLFSVSQMCDKKNSVLFNDTECIVLSPNFKLIDESQVLLRVPRKNNMYSVDLKNIVQFIKDVLLAFFCKATYDESKLWHRRLGHLNFKTMNKLVKGNLVRGLPSKLFENDQTCVACQKGKQHKASCKSKIENSISLPLHLLHMDLFGPTFVKSLIKKMYCLVVTDDYSRFTWVFFLATKDETSGILKSFINWIEYLVDQSVARTPQQNGVAERRNRTLIEAARTMLADSKLPTTFWAEAVNTACYVQNRVPFGCPVTILNTIDHLGKFDGKADEGFFVGYSLNSKAFRVMEPDWLFVIVALTNQNVSHDDDPNLQVMMEKVDEIKKNVNVFIKRRSNVLALIIIFDFSRDDVDDGAVANMNNLDTTIQVSPITTTRIHKDHPLNQAIGDLQSATQTRKMSKNLEEHRKNPKRFTEVKTERAHHRQLKAMPQNEDGEEWIVLYDTSQSKVSHLHDVKRIFSDYVGSSLDRKSTIGGCQFLGGRLISWQCKKQTVVANSITEMSM
ncbi:putative ribonuclease H-like domain-containing protein [Tanacetum coccineum]